MTDGEVLTYLQGERVHLELVKDQIRHLANRVGCPDLVTMALKPVLTNLGQAHMYIHCIIMHLKTVNASRGAHEYSL